MIILNCSFFSRFHTVNAIRISETVPPGSDIPDEELYARPPSDSRAPRGWLVDLINRFFIMFYTHTKCFTSVYISVNFDFRFGSLNGFEILLSRFQSGRNLTVPVIYALIRPFGLCYELLTVHTIVKYLMPIVVSISST